jgi:class 3 adenylate cyclase
VNGSALRATAILKTDLAGSTLRFRALGEADLTALLSEHRALLSRVAALHDGHIVKPEGDGFWLAFPSVTAAALAAMRMQEELRLGQANAGDDRLTMRIVITLGDVLHQEGAMVGDAVVLATRIEPLTPPDEIYVSEAAWLAMNRAEIRTARVDSFTVKGFADPVTVHRIEQTHRTRLLEAQYILVADLKGFTPLIEAAPSAVVESLLDGLLDAVTHACREGGGVVRFTTGDGYCLTFLAATAAVSGAEHLLTSWEAVARRLGVRCLLNVAIHKGTLRAYRSYLYGPDLNAAFGAERGSQRALAGAGGVFVTGPVRNDLAGTPWEPRLVLLSSATASARHKDVDLYRLQRD